MESLVVFESMFGNTKTIAEAIATGLSSTLPAEVVEVGVAPSSPDSSYLLVVGGPTHRFGLSRVDSRKQALAKADSPLVSSGIGIREWIKGLPRVSGANAAAFDTSIRKPNLPGSAARKAYKQLRKRGYNIAVPAEIFHVEDTTGPISDGELERAREWGELLAGAVFPSDQ